MTTVLFICRGNMVRSQIAEALYRKYRGGDATSAGIMPHVEHHDGKRLQDLGMDDWIRILKEKEGIDISNNVCRQVTERMADGAGRIVVMARSEIWPEYLRNRKDVISWEGVYDEGGASAIIDTIDRIRRLVLELPEWGA